MSMLMKHQRKDVIILAVIHVKVNVKVVAKPRVQRMVVVQHALESVEVNAILCVKILALMIAREGVRRDVNTQIKSNKLKRVQFNF